MQPVFNGRLLLMTGIKLSTETTHVELVHIAIATTQNKCRHWKHHSVSVTSHKTFGAADVQMPWVLHPCGQVASACACHGLQGHAWLDAAAGGPNPTSSAGLPDAYHIQSCGKTTRVRQQVVCSLCLYILLVESSRHMPLPCCLSLINSLNLLYFEFYIIGFWKLQRNCFEFYFTVISFRPKCHPRQCLKPTSRRSATSNITIGIHTGAVSKAFLFQQTLHAVHYRQSV